MSFDFTEFGGRVELPVGARIGDIAPEDTPWNFGVKPNEVGKMQVVNKPTLHSVLPRMAGAWDGKSTINHCDAVLKNYSGDFSKLESLIQYQPRGTCGGRAGSAAGDFIQHILIANGQRATFHRVSHAAVYYLARLLYGDIGGNWQNDGNDGVASGSVPDALKKYGESQREEISDLNYYGDGSDDLACQLAAGMHQDIAQKIVEYGKDNLLTDWVPVKSAQELADGIASGGVGLGSDGQGFTMSRDSDGFCRATGTWQHYQTRVAVGNWNGRKGFAYWQSWSKNTPSGTLLKGCPGNCFGVDFDTQDRIVKNGQWVVVFGFPLWELNNAPVVPWIFK